MKNRRFVIILSFFISYNKSTIWCIIFARNPCEPMKTLLCSFLFCTALFSTFCSRAQPSYIIPVVFHILHTGGHDNISDAQVLDAVRILNEDYNMANPELPQVISAYTGRVGNMRITFRLASVNPNGECTNGIERIYTNQTNNGSYNSSKLNQWPPDKYLNIWVYTKMNGGVAGFTYAPFSQNFNTEYDGIALVNDYIGSIGTSNPTRSRYLTQLTGRYLGLIGFDYNGFCFNQDSVGDTPPITDVSTCELGMLSCNGIDTANVQNFMNYSSCSIMFTNGQSSRVHNILNSYSNRTNIHTGANLLLTGTANANHSLCAPVADFYTTRPYACIGDSINFVDASYNGKVHGRLWQFENADISTATDSFVIVHFNTSGWQSVTLTVSNAQGSNSTTKQLVYIHSGQQLGTPYYTNFNDANDFDNNWVVINKDNDQPGFKHVTTAGHNDNTSIALNNMDAGVTGNIDELCSPAFDCSQLTNENAKVHFWLSCATSGYHLPKDSMAVYASKNCGKSWVRLFSASGNYLVNAGYVGAPFQPNNNAYWKKISLNIPGPSSNNNFRVADVSFKIVVFGADSSNNLYIDDFAIGDETVGMKEVGELTGVRLNPNPFSDKLMLNDIPIGNYEIIVSSALGQTVLKNNIVADDTGNLSLNLQAQPAGTYFITLRSSKATTIIQAVKQ